MHKTTDLAIHGAACFVAISTAGECYECKSTRSIRVSVLCNMHWNRQSRTKQTLQNNCYTRYTKQSVPVMLWLQCDVTIVLFDMQMATCERMYIVHRLWGLRWTATNGIVTVSHFPQSRSVLGEKTTVSVRFGFLIGANIKRWMVDVPGIRLLMVSRLLDATSMGVWTSNRCCCASGSWQDKTLMVPTNDTWLVHAWMVCLCDKDWLTDCGRGAGVSQSTTRESTELGCLHQAAQWSGLFWPSPFCLIKF